MGKKLFFGYCKYGKARILSFSLLQLGDEIREGRCLFD